MIEGLLNDIFARKDGIKDNLTKGGGKLKCDKGEIYRPNYQRLRDSVSSAGTDKSHISNLNKQDKDLDIFEMMSIYTK